MNKILNLLAITAFCTIATVMNGALPPSRDGREQARVVPGIRIGSGLKPQPILPENVARHIQEYLVDRSVPITIINVDGSKTWFRITFQDAQAGDQLSQFTLYPNPTTVGAVPEGEGDRYKPGESWEQYSKRIAELEKRKGHPFQQTANLPLEIPIRVNVEKAERSHGYVYAGYILLNPSDIQKIDKIEFAGKGVYLYTGKQHKGRSYSR